MTDPAHVTTAVPYEAIPAHGEPGEHGAHGAGHAGLTYYQVFFILFVATVLEVVVAQLDITRWLMVTSLILMALYKAVMVALYFMHLKFERKAMWIIASAPLIFGVILAIGVYPDSEKGTKSFQRGDLDPWRTEDVKQHE